MSYFIVIIKQLHCGESRSKCYLREMSWFFKINEKKPVLVPVGEIDLEMLSKLRLKHPGVTVDNEVVEPSGQQLHNYRGTVFIGRHLSHGPQFLEKNIFVFVQKVHTHWACLKMRMGRPGVYSV